jgi:hypothetical protein
MAGEAKFAPRNTRSFVSSMPGDSWRAVVHESGCPTGFSNFRIIDPPIGDAAALLRGLW